MNYRFRQNPLGQQVLQVEEYQRSSSRAVSFYRDHSPKG